MDSTLASPVLARRPAPPLAAFAGRSAAAGGVTSKFAAPTNSSAGKAASAASDDGFGFTDVLSMLNPLQYLPVLGSIYRAATGDKIPEAIRDIGSLAVSALTGGPMGVAISAATLALEKIAGVDADDLAETVLSGLGIVSAKGDAPTAASGTAAADAAPTGATTSRFVPWTRRQRAAYASTALASSAPGPALQGAAGLRSAFHAATRQAALAADSGVSAANSAAQRQAAANAYARRTLFRIEPLIRERIAGRSA